MKRWKKAGQKEIKKDRNAYQRAKLAWRSHRMTPIYRGPAETILVRSDLNTYLEVLSYGKPGPKPSKESS